MGTGAVGSEQEILSMGRQYYQSLLKICRDIEKEGYWRQAGSVMKQSAQQVLDLYIQSLLVELVVHLGEVSAVQQEYLQKLTQTNPLTLHNTAGTELFDEETLQYARRCAAMPPILIQVCGVYDRHGGTRYAAVFLDTVINVMLCLMELADRQNAGGQAYIRDYFERTIMFIGNGEQDPAVEESYLLYKLTAKTISSGVQWLTGARQQKTNPDRRKQHLHPAKKKAVPPSGEEKTDSRSGEKEAHVPSEQETPDSRPGEQEADTPSEQEKPDSRFVEQEVDAAPEPEKADTLSREKEQEARLKQEKQEKKRLEEEQKAARKEFEKVKKRLQDREKAEKEEREKRIAALLEELNSLVGLEAVKEEIRSLVNLIKVREMREKLHLPAMEMSYHMVFTGNPGTGKTTVARLVAKIYRELGILSGGQLVETDRSRLVAGYVGQTAINVREIVEQALGGVLFIDEAYALISPDASNDYGSEAVDTLVKMMEDHRDDLVVIVAGYTEEMKHFLRSNTGLISRFNKFISFEDYSQQQLLDILKVMAGKAGMSVEDAAVKKLGLRLAAMDEQERKDFGNARGVRNIFEKMIVNQANRIVTLDSPTAQQLMTLTAEDV